MEHEFRFGSFDAGEFPSRYDLDKEHQSIRAVNFIVGSKPFSIKSGQMHFPLSESGKEDYYTNALTQLARPRFLVNCVARSESEMNLPG